LPLKLFFQHILQHWLVEHQIGNDLLEPRVLVFELPQSTQFRRSQTGELAFPIEKRRLRDADLAADFRYGNAGLRLLPGEHNLLFGKL